ncbi:MAG: hypothetical protein R3208_21130 [Ketobacteraceae bacterium]|nr:hypothetical protein [Ketobacteraceae bacterium]
MTLQDEVRAIVDDREHGSSALLERIANLLKDQAANTTPRQMRQAFAQLREIDQSMVLVHHFLDAMEQHIESNLAQAIESYQLHWQKVPAAVAENLRPMLNTIQPRVLVHSHSGLIIQVAQELARSGVKPSFWQTRSLPGGEGPLQAQDLCDAGFDVSLIEDEQISEVAHQADCAWLGMDQYDTHGFVNKRGSAAIARTFTECGKPVYALGDSRKKVATVKYSKELFEYTPFKRGIYLVKE